MNSSFFIKLFTGPLAISIMACGGHVNFSSSSPGGLGSPGGGGSGNPPPCQDCSSKTGNETFFQNSLTNSVDILMVIDNSPSMSIFQDRVAPGFSNLISSISNVNWQIGFTTTD